MISILNFHQITELTNIDKSISPYYNTDVRTYFTTDSTSSLEYKGVEKTGGNPFIITNEWDNNEFGFRTIKIGEHKLMGGNGDKPYWEISYQRSAFYAYGAQFKISYNINNSDINISLTNRGLYAKIATKICYQPILTGTFYAKTVGGYLR